MKTGRIAFLVLWLVLTSLLLSGCSAAPTPTATSAPPSATLLPPTDTPAPTATDTPMPTSTPMGPFPTGTFKPVKPAYANEELKFLKDSTYRQTSGMVTFSGKYVVDGDKLVFNETKYTGLCFELPGSYKWSFDGKLLILTTIEEKCAQASFNGRDDINGQWTLLP